MKIYCVICSDLFDEYHTIDFLQCGHIFHSECINKWLDQSHTCPECRKPTKKLNATRLFVNFRDDDGKPSSDLLENKVASYQAKLLEKDLEIITLNAKLQSLREFCARSEELAADYKNKYFELDSARKCLQQSVRDISCRLEQMTKVAEEGQQLSKKINLLKHIQLAVDGSQAEIDDMIKHYQGPDAIKGLAATCCLLKKETRHLRDSKEQLKSKLLTLQKDIKAYCTEIDKKVHENTMLLKVIDKVKAENAILQKAHKNSLPADNEGSSQYLTPQSSSKRLLEPHESPAALTETPEVHQLAPGPPKRFKISVAPFQKVLKVSVSHRCNIKATATNQDQDNDEDSIIRNGYNGLGGHSRFIKTCVSTKR